MSLIQEHDVLGHRAAPPRSTPVERFRSALSERPADTLVALLLEYLQFMGGIQFSLLLLVTRAPLRALDDATGLRVRERLIDGVARLFPG